jgi:hypothetical protein
MGEEGDVGYLAPDATALNADFQIQNLEEQDGDDGWCSS